MIQLYEYSTSFLLELHNPTFQRNTLILNICKNVDCIEKISELFNQDLNKYSKDRTALCIGHIFRDHEITDPNIVLDIINHLTSLLGRGTLNDKAQFAIQYLIENENDSSIDIIDDGIDSLFGIIISGGNTSQDSDQHPYFSCNQEYDGMWKIYKLFLRYGNKNTRDTSAICLGFLFRSREITNIEIKVQIITFHKNHINVSDDWNKNQSRRTLKCLSYNATNRAEILNDKELKKIEHDLKLPLKGSKENRKSTILIQEYWFLLLLIVLNGRADDELRRQIIQARILDRFLLIFEQREYSLVTNIITQAFISLIKPSSKDIGLLIFIKKPFTGLLRLLNHPNSQIVDDAISSIFHMII
ncbi:MAG: hypothetical protein EZS28_040803 [Streblomastix strix]|uniref:Uncharacterized protein n=1 Tax=Streblomastix strix TaxID=222440 RepID=A0A5J4U0H7_9EUKA|nr:MAG: hypothetical protein EZS28_040803 [Streblomastix strix]